MAASRLRSLPRNVTDVTRMLACVDGAIQNHPLSPDAGSVFLERKTPIREFFSWPGKRNYEGLYWSSTNRAHVEFESLLEREYLLAADNASDIVVIAAQPLALLWPCATRGNRDHIPDFFVRLANGDGRCGEVLPALGCVGGSVANLVLDLLRWCLARRLQTVRNCRLDLDCSARKHPNNVGICPGQSWH